MVDERTKVYGEIARDSYGDVIQERGGIEYTTTEELLKVQGWLLGKPCITNGESTQAKRVAKNKFNRRRAHILKELSLLNHVLGIEETRQEQEIHEQPPQASNDGKTLEERVDAQQAQDSVPRTRQSTSRTAYHTQKEGICVLEKELNNLPFALTAWHILKRYVVSEEAIERFISLTEGYTPFNLNAVENELHVSAQEALRITSSYPGEEIREIIRRVNPNMRHQKQIFLIKKGISVVNIAESLKRIYAAMGQGHYAQLDTDSVLLEKKLHPGANYFDLARESIFERRPDGTYSKESVAAFRGKSEGYRFTRLRDLIEGETTPLQELVEALNRCEDDIVLKFQVKEEFYHGLPFFNDQMYMFRHDSGGRVDTRSLSKALGIRIASPAVYTPLSETSNL